MTTVFLQIRHPTGHARWFMGSAAGKCRVETVKAVIWRKQPGGPCGPGYESQITTHA